MRWSGFLTEYSTFFLSHDKKDRFAEFGKSSQNKRFVFMWGIVTPFARNPHTSIFRFTQKTIKNESTTANPKMNISRMSSKWSNHAEANNVKKPQL